MATTLLGSTGGSSRTDVIWRRSPVNVIGPNGCPVMSASSTPDSTDPSTTPNVTSPSWEYLAMRTQPTLARASCRPWPPASASAAHQAKRVGVLDRLPGGGDDVLVDADGVPLALPVGGAHQHPGDRAGAMRAFEDADL